MISETAFMDCENLPAEMAGRFNQPWFFVGEVGSGQPFFHDRPEDSCRAMCVQCGNRLNPLQLRRIPGGISSVNAPVYLVVLNSYRFVTDDMLEVIVYFGVCEECDAVHWAKRSGDWGDWLLRNFLPSP